MEWSKTAPSMAASSSEAAPSGPRAPSRSRAGATRPNWTTRQVVIDRSIMRPESKKTNPSSRGMASATTPEMA